MKKIFKLMLSLMMVVSTIMVGNINNVAASEYTSVYPYVQSYQTNSGTFTMARESRIFVVNSDDNQKLLDDVKLFSSQLGTILEKSPDIVLGDETQVLENDIVIKIDDVAALKDHSQSYKIDITDHITISAKDHMGIYYGMQTLIQLLKVNDYTLSQGTILDWPDTQERSMHIDIARKYYSVEWIKDLIEDMSYLKMNSLQIHFSEHEGYRLESDVLNNVDGFKYPSQYYTKAEMTEIVEYANKYHIEVIPSLDSPGHMRYVLNYLPSEYRLSSVPNLSSDGAASGTFNIFNDEAKNFLKSLFNEYAKFFSDLGCTKMNIGGDEFLNNFSLLTEEQYAGVMNYFNEITALLKEYNMTPRAWNDGLMFTTYDKDSYHLDPSIEICYWSGGDNCATIADFVANGNKVLNYADVYMYYVLAQWWDQYANASAQKIYNEWNTGRCGDARKDGVIIPQRYDEPYPEFLAGSSFALWSDQANYKTEDQVREQLKDRMRAMALKAWNTTEQMPDYTEVKAAFDKAGRAPAYQNELPAAGQVINSDDSAAIVIEYRDLDGNQIAKNSVVYGVNGNEYTINPQAIYGYKFVEASDELTGTFKGQKVIVLKYELGSDKRTLEELIKNIANQEDYVLPTYQEYKQAYIEAVNIYTDIKATQVEVDNAYQALLAAFNKLVPVSKQSLYNIVNSAILQQGSYSSASFNTYKNAVDEGSALLTKEATDQEIQAAMEKINNARSNLVLSNFLTATTDVPTYQNYTMANTIDGNRGTKFWGQSPQNVGQYFLYTFREAVSLKQVTIASGYESNGTTENADYIRGADVLVSVNGNDWQTIGKIAGNHETVIDSNVEAKYVKIQITEASGNWPQLNEVSFTYDKIGQDLNEVIANAKAIDSSLYTAESYVALNNAIINAEKLGSEASYDEIALATYNLEQAMTYLQKVYEPISKPSVSFEIEHPWIVQTGEVVKVENSDATNGSQYALNNKGASFNLNLMGDNLAIYGQVGPDNGVATIKIMQAGNVVETVEVNTNDTTNRQAELLNKALPAGDYEVVITNTSNKPVVIDYIDVANGTIFVHDPVVVDTNKTALKIAIDKANAISDEALEKVIPVVVNEFKVARDQANDVYQNASATQGQIDDAFDRLSKAMTYLEFYKGDKTTLKEFIDKVSNLDQTKYSEASWLPFADALAKANDVYNDENAMQAEVNETYEALVNAYVNLRLLPDKSLLEGLINKADSLNSANYTNASWQAMQNVLASAKEVYNNPDVTQEQVDVASEKLAKAIASLQTVKPANNSSNPPVKNGDTTSVKTGDHNLMTMYASLTLLTVAGYAVLRKKEN